MLIIPEIIMNHGPAILFSFCCVALLYGCLAYQQIETFNGMQQKIFNYTAHHKIEMRQFRKSIKINEDILVKIIQGTIT